MHAYASRIRGWIPLLFATVLMLGTVPGSALAAPAAVETFDISPVLSSTAATGAWYVDRYAPAGFAKASFDGERRLKLSISSADALANRPLTHQSTFYNTQGRNYDLPAVTSFVTADIYIGPDWDAANRRADLWANLVDENGDIVGFPIIGFLSGTGFRVWDNLGWHVVGLPEGFTYGRWYTVGIQRSADAIKYLVDGQVIYVSDFAADTSAGTSVGFDNVKLQAYNFGESYDVYFDNIGPMAPTPAPHTISASAGTHGSVMPSVLGADTGDDVTVTVTPDVGYHIEDVTVDGASIGASDTVVLRGVTASHVVSATFAINSYVIVASAGPSGWITPSGATSKTHGSRVEYAFSPYPGYHVADVRVDGVSVGSPDEYAFDNVDGDHAISVTFARTTYSVTSAVGEHGSATWSGARTVSEGSNLTILFTPDEGYVVADVTVDGVSQGAVGSYAFTDIVADHTVGVTFAPRTYSISVSASSNGTISPDSTTTVVAGGDATFALTPAQGFHVSKVLVDGASVGAVSTYTFRNVVANHRISAVFAPNPKPKLSRPYAPSSIAKTRLFTVYGYLKPRHAARTYPVRIYKWKYVSGKWRPRGYLKAKASNHSTYTKYSRKLRLESSGKWRLRAYAPADSRHAATWSAASDYVTVK